MSPDLERVATAVAHIPGLRLLALFGSRARGTAHPGSDWDLAFAPSSVDRDALLAAISGAVRSDAIDLVDLDRAGALVRLRVAQDGVPVVESEEGELLRFRTRAAITWCDMEPVLRRAFEDVLGALP